MATAKSPLELVKQQFGTKEKLVQILVGLPATVLERKGDEDKNALHQRLLKAPNRQLVRLHQMTQAVQKRWGSKEKLVDDVLKHQKRAKDKDYRTKLLQRTVGWLYDRVTMLEKKQKQAATQSA